MKLTKSQRIQVILDVANRLGSEQWSNIDLILSQFGLPTDDEWRGNNSDYVIKMIQAASDEQLFELSQHFGLSLDVVISTPSSAFEYWTDGKLKVFISHLTDHKVQAAHLKNEMGEYALSAFVAHEDITPTLAWQEAIETALKTCDILVALMQPNFVESKWCDQEIGYALGRGIPVFAVRCGADPHGFVSKFQAFNGIGKTPNALVKEIFESTLVHEKLQKKMADVVIEWFINSRSYAAARQRIEYVERLTVWDPSYTVRIEKALQQNSQIYDSSGTPKRVKDLIRKWTQTSHEELIPF